EATGQSPPQDETGKDVSRGRDCCLPDRPRTPDTICSPTGRGLLRGPPRQPPGALVMRKNTLRPRLSPKARGFFHPTLEALEDRTLLAAANVFAGLDGSIPAPGSAQQIALTISSPNFTLQANRLVVGFELQAVGPGQLDPAAVQITNGIWA